MFKIAIAASGNGSNFENIAQCIINNTIPKTTIECLIVDNPNAFVIERAKKFNIPTYIFNPKNYLNKQQYELDILTTLTKHKIELFVLAGYMRLIGNVLLNHYKQKIINIHPSYLPNFIGKQAIVDAYNSGTLTSGVTIHFVNEVLDGGKIILQEKITFTPQHTLNEWQNLIHQLEYKLYPQAINLCNPYL